MIPLGDWFSFDLPNPYSKLSFSYPPQYTDVIRKMMKDREDDEEKKYKAIAERYQKIAEKTKEIARRQKAYAKRSKAIAEKNKAIAVKKQDTS